MARGRAPTALFALLLGCAPAESTPSVDRPPSPIAPPPPASTASAASAPPMLDLADGGTIEELTLGTGALAARGKRVSLEYVARLDDGSEYGTSAAHGEPFSFVVGADDVNAIWAEAISGMRVGGVRRLRLPSERINGGQGRPPLIPAGSGIEIEFTLTVVR